MKNGTAQVGQFYRVADPEDENKYRILLVIDRIDEEMVQTCLVAHDMDGNPNLATTAHDMMIEDSSLIFPALVQTDVVGPVMDKQLVPFIRVTKQDDGTWIYKTEEKPLDPKLVEWARYSAHTGRIPEDITARPVFGSPHRPITDEHTAWKTKEVGVIQRISSEALAVIFADLDA